MPRDGDIFLDTKRGFDEINLEVVSEVGAPLTRSSTSSSDTEELAKNVAKNVLDVDRVILSKARHTSVPKTIILGSLFGIGQNGVGLGSFLKLLFGLFIAGILIWMMLVSQLSVGGLYLFLGRSARNP
jgi:hypothetical protein